MAKWCDDAGNEIKAVSAEQHCLDNPGHVVTVRALPDSKTEGAVTVILKHQMLQMSCSSLTCSWWEEQAVKV